MPDELCAQVYDHWTSHVQEPMVITEILNKARCQRTLKQGSQPNYGQPGSHAATSRMNRLIDRRAPASAPAPETPIFMQEAAAGYPSTPTASNLTVSYPILYTLPGKFGQYKKMKEEWNGSNGIAWCQMQRVDEGRVEKDWEVESNLHRIPLPAVSPPRPWQRMGRVKAEKLHNIKQEQHFVTPQQTSAMDKGTESVLIDLDSD